MSRFESVTGGAANKPASPLMWFMALLLTVFVAGCGGGGGQGQILGIAAGSSAGIPAGAIPPGGVCTAAGPTIPTVTFTDPTSGNQFVTTSTGGIAGGGKLITATFSLPMNAATITATSFTLAPVGGAVLTGTTMGYIASTQMATLTTPSALLPNTSYTAIITTSVTSATGVPVGCLVAWNFKTAGTKTGLAPIKMGLATPFGISATAGLTTAISSSTVNGNVLLDPSAFCNGAPNPVDGTGGIGSCGTTFVPTINGTVISHLYNPGLNLATIKADLNTAFLSMTPPAGPPAAGSLGGGTTLPAPTTLGGVRGSVYVPGTNYFVPGVYTDTGSSIMVTGDLTLDAGGNPDAVFVFQSFSSVGTAAAAGAVPAGRTRILLIGGAKASNVWWLAPSSATIDTYSEFQGNILAAVSITLNNGATSCGRMMAGAWVGGGGAITLGGANVVSVPGQPFAPPVAVPAYSTVCQ